jgi:hypothetical protein
LQAARELFAKLLDIEVCEIIDGGWRQNRANMPCRVNVRLMSRTVEFCRADDIVNWSSPSARAFGK